MGLGEIYIWCEIRVGDSRGYYDPDHHIDSAFKGKSSSDQTNCAYMNAVTHLLFRHFCVVHLNMNEEQKRVQGMEVVDRKLTRKAPVVSPMRRSGWADCQMRLNYAF
jgi:hypothetical protein